MECHTVSHQFTTYLHSAGYAPSTRECYRTYLQYFLRYLADQQITDLRQVSPACIRNYQLLVLALPLAEETKAMRIRPVKRLFAWLLETHQLLLDPAERIQESHRRNRSLPPVLTIKEMQQLLAQPDLSRPIQVRDRAIMETLYSSGIRLNELVCLNLEDVDLKERELCIRHGKGNRQRVVPLGIQAAAHLQRYLTEIRPRLAQQEQEAVFLTRWGRPVTGNTIRTFLFQYKKQAGISKTASPHSFRRSCATHLLQQGADIRMVQQLLGHRHLKTTQLYTRVVPTDLKQTHERTHPCLSCP